jgi:hypothetical protein
MTQPSPQPGEGAHRVRRSVRHHAIALDAMGSLGARLGSTSELRARFSNAFKNKNSGGALKHAGSIGNDEDIQADS